MNEQQEQAVEEAANNHIYNTIYRHASIELQVSAKGNFKDGMMEVLMSPELYGLQPINEREEG